MRQTEIFETASEGQRAIYFLPFSPSLNMYLIAGL